MILGGALGNLFDRLYYSAVPDFIDFHIGNFHWFIFNVSDIFITSAQLENGIPEVHFGTPLGSKLAPKCRGGG